MEPGGVSEEVTSSCTDKFKPMEIPAYDEKSGKFMHPADKTIEC